MTGSTAAVPLDQLTDELVDEEADGDDVEDEEVEDVLTVLLQEVCPDVPLLEHPVPATLSDRLQAEALHSGTGNGLVKDREIVVKIRSSMGQLEV